MKRYLPRILSIGLFVFSATAMESHAQSAKAKAHLETARAAAYEPGQDFTGAFAAVCVKPQPLAAQPPVFPQNVPPRAQWYAAPVKVFDNLYFVGTQGTDAWAVTTSEGIILLDANEHYAVEAAVIEGLKKFGLDPATIKYNVITAAHTSSYGGAKYLQDNFKTRILASEPDWNVIANAKVPAEVKPRKDMVIMDGQKLTLGDTTVTLYVTPGHTPGSSSVVLPVKDGNQRHVAAILGGRSPGQEEEGVRYFPTKTQALTTWKASLNRFRDITAKAGADVFLATRGVNDHTQDKLNALKFRTAGRPHPFVNKDALPRYLTMLSECVDAQLTWDSNE
jgi:metallo-beta-lactamase class B